MTTGIASIVFFIFLCISSIHFYWAFGGKWGADAVLPATSDDQSNVFMPPMFVTLLVAFGLLGFGLFNLITSGVIPFDIPRWLDTYGLWFIAGIFILRAVGDFKYVGFFKKIKQTKFGKNDTKFFSPLCLIIGILEIIMVLKK